MPRARGADPAAAGAAALRADEAALRALASRAPLAAALWGSRRARAGAWAALARAHTPADVLGVRVVVAAQAGAAGARRLAGALEEYGEGERRGFPLRVVEGVLRCVDAQKTSERLRRAFVRAACLAAMHALFVEVRRGGKVRAAAARAMGWLVEGGPGDPMDMDEGEDAEEEEGEEEGGEADYDAERRVLAEREKGKRALWEVARLLKVDHGLRKAASFMSAYENNHAIDALVAELRRCAAALERKIGPVPAAAAADGLASAAPAPEKDSLRAPRGAEKWAAADARDRPRPRRRPTLQPDEGDETCGGRKGAEAAAAAGGEDDEEVKLAGIADEVKQVDENVFPGSDEEAAPAAGDDAEGDEDGDEDGDDSDEASGRDDESGDSDDDSDGEESSDGGDAADPQTPDKQKKRSRYAPRADAKVASPISPFRSDVGSDDEDGSRRTGRAGRPAMRKRRKLDLELSPLQPRRPAASRPRRLPRFSSGEDESLIAGLKKFGWAQWALIVEEYAWDHPRTNINLKDRARSLRLEKRAFPVPLIRHPKASAVSGLCRRPSVAPKTASQGDAGDEIEGDDGSSRDGADADGDEEEDDDDDE